MPYNHWENVFNDIKNYLYADILFCTINKSFILYVAYVIPMLQIICISKQAFGFDIKCLLYNCTAQKLLYIYILKLIDSSIRDKIPPVNQRVYILQKAKSSRSQQESVYWYLCQVGNGKSPFWKHQILFQWRNQPFG